jgi:hypothetical protein
MATFIGFSTLHIDQVRRSQVASGVDGGSGSITNPIRVNKKFRIVDQDLVIQDFLNALNIPQGQKPGKPQYGTTVWSYVYEPNVFLYDKYIIKRINVWPQVQDNQVFLV